MSETIATPTVLGTRRHDNRTYFSLFASEGDKMFYCTRKPGFGTESTFIFEMGDQLLGEQVRVYTPEQYEELRNARIGNGDPPEAPNEQVWDDNTRSIFQAMVEQFQKLEKIVVLSSWI